MKSSLKYDHKQIKAGEETKLYLLVKVTGPQEDSRREPLPLNLSVVIDRSGSMSGKKLAYVKQAANELVQRLGPKDCLSLVSYGDDVKVELRPRMVDEKRLIKQAIDNIQINGWTNLHGGWDQGCRFVGAELMPNGVNRVLLLTDGLANRGITNPQRLSALAGEKRIAGITTTTFGVGLDYNEDFLARMANEGGGSFYFIDNPDQAEALFKEELKDLSDVVGQNLTIAIETDAEAKAVKQLYEYPRGKEQGALVYQLGDLYAEEDRYQLFELKLRALEAGDVKLGRVRISYDQILEGEIKQFKRSRQIKIKVVPKKEFKQKKPNKEVEKMVLVQGVRGARKQALAFADRGEFSRAQEVLEAMAEAIRASSTADEKLLDLYDQLLEEAKDMEFGARRYDAYARKSRVANLSAAPRAFRKHDMQDDLHYRRVKASASIERQGAPPRQIVWRGGQFKLDGLIVSIGSAPDNEIVLNALYAEKYHCHLIRRGRDWYLEDRSRGGTIANAGRVSGDFRLSRGDIIRIGNMLLELK